MASDVVIRAENLGKKYIIGHQSERESYTALRDVIARSARSWARAVSDLAAGRANVAGDELEEFWALKDVSFEIRRGDVVGVIGRNGAGKSTLLKVLSRITEPSEGRVEIRGRVASLLEVGTGFHPELTGRENIYLNGAILGMSRAEIKQKFDEIVAFAEIEKFLDTPVKRYSSGMYVRLAFAVAAHLEPEILIVDEVLAVGDAEFQKKCLGKMKDVAGHGRTVLFVSHNMAAVEQLCCQGILLSSGNITDSGSIQGVLSSYLCSIDAAYTKSFAPIAGKPAITCIQVDEAALAVGNLIVDISFESPWPITHPIGGLSIKSTTGQPIWGSNGRFHERSGSPHPVCKGMLRCTSEKLPLIGGPYLLSVWLADQFADYDAKLDQMTIQLPAPNGQILRPPPTAIGHLDWEATWIALRSTSPEGTICVR